MTTINHAYLDARSFHAAVAFAATQTYACSSSLPQTTCTDVTPSSPGGVAGVEGAVDVLATVAATEPEVTEIAVLRAEVEALRKERGGLVADAEHKGATLDMYRIAVTRQADLIRTGEAAAVEARSRIFELEARADALEMELMACRTAALGFGGEHEARVEALVSAEAAARARAAAAEAQAASAAEAHAASMAEAAAALRELDARFRAQAAALETLRAENAGLRAAAAAAGDAPCGAEAAALLPTAAEEARPVSLPDRGCPPLAAAAASAAAASAGVDSEAEGAAPPAAAPASPPSSHRVGFSAAGFSALPPASSSWLPSWGSWAAVAATASVPTPQQLPAPPPRSHPRAPSPPWAHLSPERVALASQLAELELGFSEAQCAHAAAANATVAEAVNWLLDCRC